jgi:signal transduction histidine kinase
MYDMIGGMAILLIGFDLIIYHTISHTLFSQFDSSLESTANMLSASVEQDDKDNKFDFEFNVEMMPEFVGGKKPSYYELRSSNGDVIRKSPSLGSDNLVWFKPINRPHAFKTFELKKHRVVRAIAVNFLPHSEENSNAAKILQPLILIVAYDAWEVMEKLEFLKYLLSIASVGILGLAYVIAEVVVRQGLAPFSAVAAQINNIRDDNLKNRITGENLPVEIVPIQRQLNSLLQRLEISFEREKAFNANVAHELRTPLSGIQSTIEVCLSHERQPEDYQAALQTSLEITKSMGRMTDTLLSLAKLESKQVALNCEHISLKSTVAGCWRNFADKASERGITFENRIRERATLFSDKGYITLALMNILENAVEYSDKKGRIWTESDRNEHGTIISISNTGCTLKEENLEQIFEPFWRQEQARSETGKHCGIGLSTVQKVIKALGGTVRASIQTGGVFSVHIAL